MKKRIVSFLIIFVVFLSIFPCSIETKAVEKEQQENKYGYVESEFKIYEQPSGLCKASNNLPSSFDLREEGGVTPVKDQNPYGDCWAFASMASVESNLKYTTGKEVDLSEINLAMDKFGIEGLNRGGNYYMSISYFENGSGPVLERDNPYPSSGQPPVYIKAPATYNVNNALFLPNRKDSLDNIKIKEAIIDNGAVAVSYYHDESYLADDGVSYYYNNNEEANHGVALVGYDDNYPKEKFKNTPAGNGAFIVKNSYGTSYGDSGYFYISYYDNSLGKNLIGISKNTEPVDNVDNKYTYGKYDVNYLLSSDEEEQFIANVNKAKKDELLSGLLINTLSTSAAYEVYVDEDYNELNYPSGNINYLLGKKRKSGILEYAGANTIKLDKPIEVKQGKRFMVAIRYKDKYIQNLDFIDDAGKENTFEIRGDRLYKKYYNANALTVYSYNKNAESTTDINIDKASLALKIGEKSQIKASVVGSVYTSKRLKWTSSNPKVAVVDEDGVVTGRGNGNSTITVSNRSGSIKKTINISINTSLSVVSDFNEILKDGNFIAFDDEITPSIDYSKITIKAQDGKTLPISTRIYNRKLFIKVNSKYLGNATLSIPQNAVKNKVDKGLSSDINLGLLVNSHNETDTITLGSKDIMKTIADNLNKSESEITIGDITNISSLHLDCDNIDFKDIELLTSLTYLDVKSNGNSENLKSLKLLKNLKGVEFQNVNMINLNYLKNNINLDYISMNNCGLFSLEGIESLVNITDAEFHTNYIKDIKGIGELKKLESLSLDYNKITDISSLVNCTQLINLGISNNEISSLKGIESLKKLSKLYADYNNIKDLMPLEYCTSISDMRFNYNEIDDLTPIKNLSEVKTDSAYIDIECNHIDTQDVLSNYLKDKKGWSVSNYQKKADFYEVNEFNITKNSMNSKNKLAFTFNKAINKNWEIRFYKYDKNFDEVDIPYKIIGNKIFVENKSYNEYKYNLYYNIDYSTDKEFEEEIISYINITKTAFYTEDINKDNIIDIKDLASVSTHYNETAKGEIEKWNYDKDVNLDGVIDIYDLVYVSKAM